jgi:hypothetical protein
MSSCTAVRTIGCANRTGGTRLEHPDPGQPIYRRRGLLGLHSSQRRDMPQLRPMPQDRGRPRNL